MIHKGMTVNELLVLMRRVRERIKSLESLKAQSTTRSFYSVNAVEKREEPQYDIKALDKKVMELENFLFKADSAIKQSNAITQLSLEINVDALLAPLE